MKSPVPIDPNKMEFDETQKQLKKKEQAVESISEKLKNANKELDSIKTELKSEKSQNSSLTKQIERLEVSKQQLLKEAEDWNEKHQDLTERYETLQKGQTQVQEDLAFKENELEVLRDCFLQMKAFENEDSEDQDETDSTSIQDKLKSMMDVSGVNARLKTVEDERNIVQNRIDIEVQSRIDMEEQIAELERKMEGLKTDKMKAERQSNEATTKLNVLTNYFKEKEAQLQRELGEQEALKKQNKNRLENADETAKMVTEELESYKSQTDDLKKEILSAERDFRSQIAANEKKAHDNWLSARAAERELKESRHECSVLRQKLTDLERRLMQGPSGLIRPLPTRGMPPPGMINGPLHPSDRPGSRSGLLPPPPGMRDDDMRGSPGPVRLPPPDRRGPRMPPPEMRSPPPPDRHGGPRMPPPDLRSPPPFGRGPPPPMDRRSPPPYGRGPPGYRMPPPHDMLPPHLRGPPPPRSSSPPRIEPSGAGTTRHREQDQDHTQRQSSQV
ncbi:unnamed protein product [Mytilus edulis]|uniref:Uncharacterized protein n=1 Tax=Mytilus edulis TaxID=6550 RepID=A0A8S3QH57_MYTED|nr:unnamed protein product [Mytilus edulis]